MTRYGLGVLILRVVIPLLMTTSIITRPSFISLIYLAMMLYLPFINLLDERNIDTGLFKYVMIFLPFQTAATQSGFYLYTISSNEIMLEENNKIRRLMKNFGLSLVDDLEPFEVMCWLGPEAIMLLVSVLYTWAVKMISSSATSETMDQIDLERVHREKFTYLAISASTGKFITICILLISALWRHSVFGLAYFLIYLFFMSCWALYKDLRKLLSQLLFFCMPITIIHTVWQYVYQIEIIQANIPKDSILNRLFGIDMLIEPKPEYGINFTHYQFNTDNLLNLSYPLVVYILYHFMVNEAVMLNSLDKFIKEEEKRGGSLRISKKDREEGRKRIMSVTSGKHKIQVYIVDVIQTTGSVMFHYSYVGSICIMMIWAVTFINVISFVLLLMSILLWMVPRKKTVTVICCYFLCAFSYGNMAYTYMQGVDTGERADFGVVNQSKVSLLDFMDLARRVTVEVGIKVFYTFVFWATIRQYREERLLFTSMTALLRTESEIIRSARKAGRLEEMLWRILVRWWIVLLMIFLFVAGITGQKMNLFRILNMFKYLLFMLILQLSFKAWRAVLYVYSIFLIIMSLFTMLTTYLYQFPVVDRFIEEVFHVPRSLNTDLGLVKVMSLRDYINRIIVPAVYIVMNLIQMNFFHEPFMALTDEKNTKIAEEEDDHRANSSKITRLYMDFVDMIFLFLEFHMLKVVTLVLFLMCILDPCALYFLILLPQCLTMVVPFKLARVFVMYWAAILVSIHNMMRMIYALRYVNESDYDVTCNMTKHPEISQIHGNFANWLGFKKYKESEKTLFSYLLWQTLFVAATSINNIVFARQRIKRVQRGLSKKMPDAMFPDVTFREADSSLKSFIKYVLNYGYYRFGYEISLITTAAVIAVRLDGYAIMYCGWLCLLLILKRSIVRWLWTLFVLFTSLSIAWQYIMAIGMPPHWCQEYEWESRTHYWTVAQDFWFLVDNYKPPPIKKLIAESLLCIVSCRQLHNFWREIRHARKPAEFHYDGGSNKSILVHFEEPGHSNHVPDFTTYTTSYLDMFKRIFLNVSYYGSIWIVFLGGVNRNNIFSVVYLCYVFVYLWYGLNLYYKPLHLILKSWNNLIAQNVLIIVAKALLQVVGCFYLYMIPMSYCAFIKLFGIGCVRRFENTDYFEQLEKSSCNLRWNELAGIGWDVVIFAFLMLQRRVFMSYNFFLIIDEAKAGHLLSARGATILHDMKAKEINAINEENARIKELIANEQKKAKAIAEKYQGVYARNIVTNHPRATRVGDFYMFEEPESQIEIDLLPPIDVDEGTETDITLTSLIVDMYETSMSQAVRQYWGNENEYDDEDEPNTWRARLLCFLKFCLAILDSLIVDARHLLDKHTGHYKTVRDTLEKEKRLLKETTDYYDGVRVEGWWLPRASYDTLIQKSKLPKPNRPPKEITHDEQPNIVKMIQSLWIITLAKSDLLCYFLIIMNQIMFCQLITLPLVVMVFSWGTLSNPRPSKTYWIIMLGYVEWVILLKCIFQFEVMPGNVIREKVEFKTRLHKNNQFFPPLVFGLQAENWYYIWEMFILFAIIMHRQYLKTIGLWSSIKDTTHQETLDGVYTLINGELVPRIAPPAARSRVYFVESSKANALDRALLAIKMILIQYGINLRDFHQRLFLHVFQKPTDLYTPMFICDITSMVIIGIGYPAFLEFDQEDNDKTLLVYISESIIPVKFVLVLFAHMVGSLVDRAIYLRRDLTAKLIVQLLNVIVLHLFLFIFLPIFGNGRQANGDIMIILYYIFRCLYLLISACQIRRGYPSRIWGYYMTHDISAINYCIFFSYMNIPIFYEMRVLLDWMFTDTTMSIFEYFKMEDLYVTLFDIKCKRQVEDNHSVDAGEKKVNVFKYIYGSAWILFILLTIWFPIMYVAWGRTVGDPSVPHHARLTLTIGTVDPIYDNQAARIYQFNYLEYEYLLQIYNAYAASKVFMHGYTHSDVCALVFDQGSEIWMIREQDKLKIIKQLVGAHPIPLVVQWEIGVKIEGQVHLAKGSLEKSLYPFTSKRLNLAKMISFSDDPTLKPQTMRYLIPKYLKYKSEQLHIVDVLMKPDSSEDGVLYRNVTTGAYVSEADNRLWWKITETCEDPNYFEFLQSLPYDDCGDALIIYIFSDKLVPDLLGFSLASGGILGLYAMYFMLLNEVVREFAIEDIEEVWIEENEMINIRRFYNLSLMVYICREMGNWEMEEWAYARLLAACRSREVFQRLGLRKHWRKYEEF